MQKLKVFSTLSVLILSAGLAGCSYSTPATPPAATSAPSAVSAPAENGTVSVSMKKNAFSPAQITIKAGQTVTWTDNDQYGHNVTGDGFASGPMSAGETYSYTFAKEGTYNYSCTIHAGMTGTVTVTK